MKKIMYFIITMVFGVMIGITLNMFGQVTELLPEIIKNNFESGMVADHQTQSNQAKKKRQKYKILGCTNGYKLSS